MSDADHVEYFRQRAVRARELAKAAPAPYIARIHTDMAALYDALVEQPQLRDRLKVVADPWGPEAGPL